MYTKNCATLLVDINWWHHASFSLLVVIINLLSLIPSLWLVLVTCDWRACRCKEWEQQLWYKIVKFRWDIYWNAAVNGWKYPSSGWSCLGLAGLYSLGPCRPLFSRPLPASILSALRASILSALAGLFSLGPCRPLFSRPLPASILSALAGLCLPYLSRFALDLLSRPFWASVKSLISIHQVAPNDLV